MKKTINEYIKRNSDRILLRQIYAFSITQHSASAFICQLSSLIAAATMAFSMNSYFDVFSEQSSRTSRQFARHINSGHSWCWKHNFKSKRHFDRKSLLRSVSRKRETIFKLEKKVKINTAAFSKIYERLSVLPIGMPEYC